MITLDREAFQSQPLHKLLPPLLHAFGTQRSRLARLHRYAQGRHDILLRTRPEGLPNQRLSHGFPRYIAQLMAGYLLGEPVDYENPHQPEAVATLSRLYRAGGAEQADMELGYQQSVFGRAVSLCYHGQEGQPQVAALDPRSAFVVRDDTVERRPLMGVLLAGTGDHRTATIYTAEQVLRCPLDANGRLGPARTAGHLFGRVPMVEYLNDLEGQGDFEEVLPLIDAYDLLSSDRLNDRAQFADALLVLTGVMGLGTAEDPTDFRSAARRLRQDRTLALPDSDAKAEWLLKNPVEKDIDVLRQALANDIHKFSMTPDFSDERFAGNLSGIAIKYKLFCLEQKIRLKERWFISGLRERARLMAYCMAQSGLPALDAEQLTIRLQRRLPESALERAQTLRTLAGLVPDSTLAEHAPINDPTTA